MSQYGAPEGAYPPQQGMGYGQPPQNNAYGAGAPGQEGAGGYPPQQGQYGQGQPGQEQPNEQYPGQEPGAGAPGEEQLGQPGEHQANGEMQQPGEHPDVPGEHNQVTKAGIHHGAIEPHPKPGPASQHPHSRFHQDPHHHHAMQAFHKIASNGLTPDHIHSLVHIGTLGLAMLAHNSGMTAGHEPEEHEQEQQAAAK